MAARYVPRGTGRPKLPCWSHRMRRLADHPGEFGPAKGGKIPSQTTGQQPLSSVLLMRTRRYTGSLSVITLGTRLVTWTSISVATPCLPTSIHVPHTYVS